LGTYTFDLSERVLANSFSDIVMIPFSQGIFTNSAKRILDLSLDHNKKHFPDEKLFNI
jgi:hypothetical protein